MGADDFILGDPDPLTRAQDAHDRLLVEYKKAIELLERAYPEMLLLKYKHYPNCEDYIEWQKKADVILKKMP